MPATEATRALPPGLPPALYDMDPEMFRRRFGRAWTFEVVEAYDIGPRMRRVVYTADDIDELSYKPGQEIILMLPQPDGSAERRHYTVRSLDKTKGRLDVDFVLHGDSPAGRYCRDAKPGDSLMALGPRGRHVIRDGADWRLFVGDESSIPAIFGMLESLPAGSRATAFIEVSGPVDQQPLLTAAAVELHWVQRRGEPGSGESALAEAAAGFRIPQGVGHAYTLGETSAIRRVRQDLIARGMPKENISAEGYWRPGRVGGHEHVDD